MWSRRIRIKRHVDVVARSRTLGAERRLILTLSSAIQVYGNLNTPRAVAYSGVIYCLRCMVGHDIPLNQGCLKPVTIEVRQQLWAAHRRRARDEQVG